MNGRPDRASTIALCRMEQPSVPQRRYHALVDDDTPRRRRDNRSTSMCRRVVLRGQTRAVLERYSCSRLRVLPIRTRSQVY